MSVHFEIYEGLPRQGPGSDEATLDALARLHGLPERPEIIDMGCGIGRQSILLAETTKGRVTVVDTHPPFLRVLEDEAKKKGLSGNIRTLDCPMESLDLPDGSFDLVWAEGAIYIMGFRQGLDCWRRLVKPGGFVAVTELSWLVDEPPAEAASFWAANYPGMNTLSGNTAIIRDTGYVPVDTMVLPESAWWEDYYLALEKRISVLRGREETDAALLAALDDAGREIDLFRRYAKSYGYVFYIMKKPA